MRSSKIVLLLLASPFALSSAQLSAGVGPLAHASSTTPTPWKASAQLAGTARYDHPLASLRAEGAIGRSGEGTFALQQLLFTPARAGFRGTASYDLTQTSATATTSLSYRSGSSGSWLGVGAARGTTSSLRLGVWRQLSEWLTVAVSSSLRRAGNSGPMVRTQTISFVDSTYTDTGGWKRYPASREVTDTTVGDRRMGWLESEARVGMQRGRFALDGFVGWRPPVDSMRSATWYRAMGTVALGRSVALSLGGGTTTSQVPFVRGVGRYGVVGLRFAPAALVRPNDTPEITPAAVAFRVERVAEQEYVVRVRLPRARVVELSGDFNGWQPMRLTRASDDSWTASVALKPGTYRMNIRIDGEQWVPPPGTPAVEDEFNGKVGLVVVR